MHEFERSQPTELIPVTRALIAIVQSQTGLPVEIRMDPHLKERARAIYAVSDPDTSRHLVLVDQGEQRHINHLVAHEIGHILQYAEIPANKRKVPVGPFNYGDIVKSDIAGDLARLQRQGLDNIMLDQSVRSWTGGIISQLNSIPADIGIENDIRNNQALRMVQRNSLADQALLQARDMEPYVKSFTPPKIWLASNAMNYALTKPSASFLNESWMLRPYRNTDVSSLGDELLELMREIDPYSLDGYQKVTDSWADRLGFGEWFHWQNLDKVRKGEYSNDKKIDSLKSFSV